MFLFSPLFCFLFLASPLHFSPSLLLYCLYFFHSSSSTPFLSFAIWLLDLSLSVLHSFASLSLSFHLFCGFCSLSYLCPVPSLSLSQITVSVAQGRVQSPSPQPRYKSYAYTQAAYVKSPEQKRRRFTDQVRVSLTLHRKRPPVFAFFGFTFTALSAFVCMCHCNKSQHKSSISQYILSKGLVNLFFLEHNNLLQKIVF